MTNNKLVTLEDDSLVDVAGGTFGLLLGGCGGLGLAGHLVGEVVGHGLELVGECLEVKGALLSAFGECLEGVGEGVHGGFGGGHGGHGGLEEDYSTADDCEDVAPVVSDDC
jgi:hypothetical protein